MTLSVIVAVSAEELTQFKTITKKIFQLIERITGEKTPTRKGLDLLSQAFGYSSHPDMVRLSKGVHGKPELTLQLREKAKEVAQNLLLKGTYSLRGKDLLNCILSVSPEPAKSVNSFAEISGSVGYNSASSDVGYEQVRLLHAAMLEKNFDEVSAQLKNVDWSKRNTEKEAYLTEFFFDNNKEDDVCYLLNETPFFKSGDYQSLFEQSLEKRFEKLSINLIDKGVDITGYSECSGTTLVRRMIQLNLSNVLCHCINNCLYMFNEDDFIYAATSSHFVSTLAQIDRVASNPARVNAAAEATCNGASYSLLFFLKNYPHLPFEFNNAIQSYHGSIAKLESLLLSLKLFGVEINKEPALLLKPFINCLQKTNITTFETNILARWLTAGDNGNLLIPCNLKEHLDTLNLHKLRGLLSLVIHFDAMDTAKYVISNSAILQNSSAHELQWVLKIFRGDLSSNETCRYVYSALSALQEIAQKYTSEAQQLLDGIAVPLRS